MKLYSIITKLILFPYILFSQGVITNNLHELILNQNPTSLIPIIIEVNDDFDLSDLKKDFEKNNINIKKRASIICDKMQKVASETQQPIIDIIKKNNYNNLKTSWIINSIFLDAEPKMIQALSNHPNIALISLQNTTSDIIEYIEEHENNTTQIEDGTEPGIEAINVRPLWEMGYTGKGIIVFNYDTGVWPDHPAFSNRFLANSYPMNQCWDGYFSDSPNGHVSDHGTHTLGTMAGLISETNDTIGIAFNGYWIANDFVTSSVETLPPIADMITSFEWALNPDGDTSTYYDVPDVINNSWRWYNEMDTFQCSGYAVELMNVIEAAGIANIFSAGNNGPDNEGVRSPQRINSNLVNTFCVGSVNANDENLPISTFSCRGPTQCPGEGSLSIYPEVVAPGQNVRSAWGSDSFNTISGTSMASPHVSGAVMLLKEAFPFLTGEEILLALYYTASDLGELGEDNTYGMGIIDAYAAFNYLTLIYEPVLPNAISNDLVLTNIINTPQDIECESLFTPTINILNNTDSIIEEIKIYYIDYLSQSEEDSIISQVNLYPDQDINVELPTINNGDYGNKEFGFRISTISPLIENDYHNNRKMVRYKYKPTLELPFLEDFQNGISNENWHITNDDYSRTWDTIETGGLSANNIAAYVNLYGYNPRAEQKDELISPNIMLFGDSINLSFQVAYQKYNSSSKQDTLTIFLSNNCGESYDYKIFEKGGEDLSTYDEVTNNFIPENNNQWRQEIVELNNFSNDEIMLKFVTTNLRGNNILIDNINIYNEENASSLEEKELDISAQPNPSSGIFTILCQGIYVEDIKIYNSIGQLNEDIYMNKKLHKYELDFTNKKSGLYFLSIKTERENKTLKIIKK